MLTQEQIQEVVAAYGTPLYIIDRATLSRRIALMRESLPKRVRLVYAMKANPFLVPLLDGLVDGFEVCSTGEYRICQKGGVDQGKLIISGVNKDVDLIEELASGYDGCVMTAESALQFNQILESAHAYQVRIPVLLRLTSANQFGMDSSEVRRIIERYQHDPYVDIRGIHYFSGTQKVSPKRIRRELTKLDAFIESLRDQYGFDCKDLEYGPGLPVAYFAEDEFDEQTFLAEVSQIVDEMSFAGQITFEHGRFIAADCGTYVTRVVDTKCNKGQNYAIVDGGMHQLVYYGHAMAMHQPGNRLLGEGSDAPEEEWAICGSLCTTNDILAKQLPLRGLHVGSLLSFEKAGAYCMMEGPVLLLSRDIPAIILRDTDGSLSIIRQARQINEFNTYTR